MIKGRDIAFDLNRDPYIDVYYDPRTKVYKEEFQDVSIFYSPFSHEDFFHDPFNESYRRKYETPLDDELGIVDDKRTIDLVQGLVQADFNWGNRKRYHHWQHPDTAYPGNNEDLPNLKIFRNLPINRMWLPLQMERTIHEVTLEPPVPDDWVVKALTEYFRAARVLKESAEEILEWRRLARNRRVKAADPEWAAEVLRPDQNGKDVQGNRVLKKRGRYHSTDFATSLARFKDIPPEHRLVDTDAPPERVVRDLSSLFLHKTLDIRPIIEAA